MDYKLDKIFHTRIDTDRFGKTTYGIVFNVICVNKKVDATFEDLTIQMQGD